jgi:hypothetical protein
MSNEAASNVDENNSYQSSGNADNATVGSHTSKFSITFCCTSHNSEVYIAQQSFTSWAVKGWVSLLTVVLLQVLLLLKVLLHFYFTFTPPYGLLP